MSRRKYICNSIVYSISFREDWVPRWRSSCDSTLYEGLWSAARLRIRSLYTFNKCTYKLAKWRNSFPIYYTFYHVSYFSDSSDTLLVLFSVLFCVAKKADYELMLFSPVFYKIFALQVLFSFFFFSLFIFFFLTLRVT